MQLWFADPSELADPAIYGACTAILDAPDTAHWQRFRATRDQHQAIASRALRRLALSAMEPVPPAFWKFKVADYGKPVLACKSDLRFNLSNTPGLVACLTTYRSEVGIDIVRMSDAELILNMSSDVFSPLEQTQLSTLCGDDRHMRACALWALKEAYIKASGQGLAIPLPDVSFHFSDAGSIQMSLASSMHDRAARWQFCLLDHANHRVALMTERGTDCSLHTQSIDFLSATSKPIATQIQGWF